MAMNFSAEEIKNMYRFYTNMLATMTEKTKVLATGLQQQAKNTHYEPVVILSNNILKFYNEDLIKKIEKSLEEWTQSEFSFQKFLDRMKAGESAKQTGKNIERKIIDDLKNGWKTVPELGAIDTSAPVCKKEDIEQISQMISTYKKDMDDCVKDTLKQVRAKQDENSMYVSILPVIETTGNMVSDGFSKAADEGTKVLKNDFVSQEKNARKIASEGSKSFANEQLKKASFASLKAGAKKILE